MSLRSSRSVAALRQLVLTVGAVVGALCILVTIAAVVFDVRPLVFRSGSMSPTIETGALALAREVPAADLRVGDIVSVPTPAGDRVTHRIVSVELSDGLAVLQLKGDANEVADAAPYVVPGGDVVLFDVPGLGYAVNWLTGPIGLFTLGLYAAFLVSVMVRGTTHVERPSGGRRRAGRARQGRRRLARSTITAAVLAVGLTAGLVTLGTTRTTLAAWADPSTVSGTKQSAYAVPLPGEGTCTASRSGTTGTVTLKWPTNVSPLPTLGYTPLVTGVTTSGGTPTLSVSGSTETMVVRYSTSTTANQSKTVTVTATPYATAATTWTGPPQTWKFKSGASSTTAPTCGENDGPNGVITAPDEVSRTRAAERTYLTGTSGCNATNRFFCGTMADSSTVTNVDYILERTVGTTVRCWTGSWSTTCSTYQAATIGSQTAYYATGTLTSVYTAAGAYELTVRITDTWGNTSTEIVNFTLT